MTTLFDSADGNTYAVIEMGHCPRHGDFPAVIAMVYADDTTGDPTSRLSCPACRKEQREKELFGTVCIPRRFQGKRLEDFEVTDRNREVVEYFRDYAAHLDERIEAGTCIILTGRPGTGKTHLACALLTVARGRCHQCLFTSVAGLVRAVRDTWRVGAQVSESQMIQNYVDLDLLVIDEVGVQAKSDNERNILFAVINGRYEEMKPTIILSNETLREVKEIIGERAFDRLREGGGRAFSMQWESYRPKAHPAPAPKFEPLFRFYERELHPESQSEETLSAPIGIQAAARQQEAA